MGDIVVELTKGLSPKKSMTFSPGKPAETFSLGQQGVWSVSGAGVGPVHAYLFFDGTTLFVASADPAASTSVDGAKVSADWFPLAPPCEVAVGEARLKVSGGAPKGASIPPKGMIEENNPTMAMDPMKAMAMMGPPAPPAPGESTRFQPDPPAPVAFAPMAPMPGFGPTPLPPAGGPPGAAPAPLPAGASPLDKLKAEWAAATPTRRATVLAIPGILLASYLLFAEDEPETVTSKPVVATTASASASAKPTAEPPTTRATSPSLPAAPTGSPAAGGAAPADPPPRTGKDKDAPIKTTQRLAADAISAGNNAEALRLYQTLSKENPNDPAFKEAIRILKAKQ